MDSFYWFSESSVVKALLLKRGNEREIETERWKQRETETENWFGTLLISEYLPNDYFET